MNNGLLRHNFYNVQSSIKGTIIIFAVVLLGGFAVVEFFIKAEFFAEVAVFAMMGSCGSLHYTLIYNDNLSKWNSFALTTPVSRDSIMLNRYLAYSLFGVMGLVMGCIGYIIISVPLGEIDFERFGHLITTGFVLLFLVPSFFQPLILKLGVDKAPIIFGISVGVSIGLFVVSSGIVDSLIDSDAPYDMGIMYRLGVVLFCIVAFVLSYFVARSMYRKRDL